MRLVNDDQTYALERAHGVLAHTHRLDQCNDEILLEIELVPLDPSDCRARAKLLDSLDPLICKKLFVNNNHCPDLEVPCECESNGGFTKSARKGKNATTNISKGPSAAFERFVLSCLLTESAAKANASSSGRGSGILGGRAQAVSAIVPRNADALGRFSKHLKCRWAYTHRIFNCSDSKFFFYFFVDGRHVP